jgi:predicted DNA binding CopG/RHH family protein
LNCLFFLDINNPVWHKDWMDSMSPETISFLEIFSLSLLVIISGLLLLALSAYALVRYWQKRTQVDLDQARKHLRTLTSQSKTHNLIGQDYSPADPPPFGSLAAEFATQLIELNAQLEQLHRLYAGIQNDFRSAQAKEWITWVRMPYDWYLMRNKIHNLYEKQFEVEQFLKDTQDLVETIHQQGWNVALQARELLADNQTVVQILSWLQKSDLRDPYLDLSLEDARECDEWLSTRIPIYFLSGDQSGVLAEADKESISQVYKMLSQARPAVEELVTKAKSWEAQYNALNSAINDLVSNFRLLSPIFSELESNPINPLQWDQSRQVMAGLRVQIEGLSTTNRTRTIEQMSTDLETARELSIRQSQLSSHSQEIKRQYHDLLELINNPEIRQGQAWIRQAQKTVEQMQEYSPENWDRSDAVAKLADDLKFLGEEQREIDISDPSTPVLETKLPQLLEQAKSLGSLHQALRQRVASAQARHGEIKEAERASRETLSAGRALLNQAASVAGSNPHLSKAASLEIKQLRESVEQMIAEFDQPQDGNIDKKASKSMALIKKAEAAATRWLDQLSQSLSEKIATLDNMMVSLQDIANLEDPAVVESNKLLSQVSLPDLSKRGTAKSLTFSESIAELKKRNEEWQRCIAASRALEDIEGPVLERFSQAEEHRSQASEWLNRAVTIIPEGRSWPATTQILTSERQQFDLLDEELHLLKGKPFKAIDLVSRLSDLSSKFMALAVKLKQSVENAQQDHNRINELEGRFEESCQLWQDQMRKYSDHLRTRESISKLLKEAEKEIIAIRQRYKREGLSYQQVLQHLRSLCQKIDSAVAVYDENHVIDINGELQAQ